MIWKFFLPAAFNKAEAEPAGPGSACAVGGPAHGARQGLMPAAYTTWRLARSPWQRSSGGSGGGRASRLFWRLLGLFVIAKPTKNSPNSRTERAETGCSSFDPLPIPSCWCHLRLFKEAARKPFAKCYSFFFYFFQ